MDITHLVEMCTGTPRASRDHDGGGFRLAAVLRAGSRMTNVPTGPRFLSLRGHRLIAMGNTTTPPNTTMDQALLTKLHAAAFQNDGRFRMADFWNAPAVGNRRWSRDEREEFLAPPDAC